MLLTPHVFIGLAIAKFIPNPFVAPLIAFFSHFLGDLVPHWDFFSNSKKEDRLRGWRPMAVMADLGLGIAVGVFFTTKSLWLGNDPKLATTLFLSGIAAVLPDALEAPYMYLDKFPAFIRTITNVQKKLQNQAPVLVGISIQLAIILICSLVLF